MPAHSVSPSSVSKRPGRPCAEGGRDPDDSLGVAATWLSPFYRSPMADSGYDISDYTDVDLVFGTLADFDDLRAGAHRPT